jgi:hypothetical protein
MEEVLEMPAREGWRSVKYGHRGVHFLCTGPDPAGPKPGEAVHIVVYDAQNHVVRQLRQRAGRVIDSGYVDLLVTSRCRPSVVDLELVDTDADGVETVLLNATSGPGADAAFMRWFTGEGFAGWVAEHGVE